MFIIHLSVGKDEQQKYRADIILRVGLGGYTLDGNERTISQVLWTNKRGKDSKGWCGKYIKSKHNVV